MRLEYRILVCIMISLPLTLVALFLDKDNILLGLSKFPLVFISGILLYALSIYAAFLSEDVAWTVTLTVRLLKNLVLGLCIVTLGFFGLYLQAQAFGDSLSVNWFGFLWLLILFSGLGFNRTSADKKIPVA